MNINNSIQSEVNNNIFLNILHLLLFLFLALRPIIDLQGRFEGNGLNLGGAIGLIIFILVIMVFCFSKKSINKTLIFLYYLFIMLCLLFVVNAVFSNFDNLIIIEFSRLLIGFSLIFLLSISNKKIIEKNVILYIKLFIFSCFIPIVIAWCQFFGIYPYTYFDVVNGDYVGRPSGGYFQPSSLTRIMIFFAIYLYITRYLNLIKTLPMYILLFISILTTVISTHRTSVIIILLIVVLFEMFNFLEKKKIKLESIILFIVFFIPISLFLFIYTNYRYNDIIFSNIQTSILNMLSSMGSLNINSDDFLRGRGWRWERTIEYMNNSFLNVKLVGNGYQVYESHNDMLNIYMVTGAIGCVLFFTIYSIIYVYIRKRVDLVGKRILFVVFITFFIFGITLQPTFYPNFMCMFFVTLIIILIKFNNRLSI